MQFEKPFKIGGMPSFGYAIFDANDDRVTTNRFTKKEVSYIVSLMNDCESTELALLVIPI